MKKIKTVEEAIDFLENKAGINVDENTHKWTIWDIDFRDYCKDDKELIDYANEQMEAIMDD